MLYEKNKEKELPLTLFENPTSEYRGAPFWAWNCALTEKLLDEQIDFLKEMGFGGFHMHPRTGFATPYLSDEHMGLVRFCVDKAKREGMYAYLYDEDRWPSGAAGGLVTKDPQYRQKFLSFTPARGSLSDGERLLACYDVELDGDGCLKHYRRIEVDQEAAGTKWFAYLKAAEPSPWYNNQTYVDTLSKKAIDRFIEVTYETYKNSISGDFGGAVPSIFTDEPQFSRKSTLSYPEEKKEIVLPWTDDLAETFRAAYGEDLMEHLPQLFWELPRGQVSAIRYHYHDHVTERFTEAFADNCGKWCGENSLMLTGHMLEEPTLSSQTANIGEAMRAYRSFQFPGIDMLCNWFEYTTAKQAQSAAHQYGREGVLSELYGVTGWAFDFRGHKIQGDWQAALGITLRVPHLSWVSMAGEAKRDYPASINYQSPWYKEYSYIEDHFARVNTAMTRGKPLVRVGVIHPVESYWLHWGPSQQTSLAREQLETNFRNVTEWLLFGGIDFDFISESLLPDQCAEASAPLRVGEMAYDVILVPGCETLRSSTLKRLKKFRKLGGRLIFLGEAPKYLDAEESEKPTELYEKSERLPMARAALLQALENVRTVEFRRQDGSLTDNLIYQLRQDQTCRWLFVAHGREPKFKDNAVGEKILLMLEGNWSVNRYDTLDGAVSPMPVKFLDNRTRVEITLFNHDSLLLQLTAPKPVLMDTASEPDKCGVELVLPKIVPITLEEPNVLLLDHAEYALDDEAYAPAAEILRADNVLREKAGYPRRCDHVAQPWTIPEEPFCHVARLRMSFESLIEADAVQLALEDAENAEIRLNGELVPSVVTGWYVDRSIQTVPLGQLRKGTNVLELKVPFGKRSNLEWCYILGDFGVRVRGEEAVLTEPVRELGFGDITTQGLPFYGGNIQYHIPVQVGEGELQVHLPHYRGALAAVFGKEKRRIVFAPYTVTVPAPETGILDITLFGNRANTFGALHRVDETNNWFGPDSWRTVGDRWSESYRLFPTGLLSAPVIHRK